MPLSSPPSSLFLASFLALPRLLPRLLPSSSRTSITGIHAKCSLPDLNHDQPRQVFLAGPQPRPSIPSIPCRTSTTTIHPKYSLPDLNHDHPRPVFPAGPQPRPSTPSVPRRTSTATCLMAWLPSQRSLLQDKFETIGSIWKIIMKAASNRSIYPSSYLFIHLSI